MKQNTKTAFITTLIQLPAILWQHMFIAMYLYHTTRVLYFQPLNIGILVFMVMATFSMAYFRDKINQTRWQAYWLIPLAFIIALVFDSNFIMQILLFIGYLLWMFLAKPILVHKVKNYYENGKVDEVVYKRFSTFTQAKNHLENKLKKVLIALAKESKDVDDLNQKYMQSDNDYRINDKNSDTLLFSSLWYVKKRSGEIFKQANKNMTEFSDLLKRGNLPDDDRIVPNWLKIKNRQFDDVDFSNNTVDDIIVLSSDEFNEFVSSSDHGLLLTFLSTLSDAEIARFYQYNDDVVKLDENVESASSQEQFQSAMAKVDVTEISDEQRARATLEIPLMISFSKNIYHTTLAFQDYVKRDYYEYSPETNDVRFEATLSSIIWDEMSDIPNGFEQVLSLFRDFCDKDNFKDTNDENRIDKSEHQLIFKHLAQRFGGLIIILNNMSVITEEKSSGTNWFVNKMVDEDLIGNSLEISVSETEARTTDKKLIDFLALTFLGICDENEDNYLEALINTTNTLFEFYPANSEACEYAMVEMMKSVALKTVSVDNENSFVAFFETLPKFYEVLSYDKIYELKELINYTLANHKPQDNDIFDQDGVKNKMILLNYLLYMEDLYYEGRVNE